MLPKIIWILWFQGWQSAPEIVKRVRQTWQHHNPAWVVISLDENNLKHYLKNYPLPNTTYQAKSDIIRLDLLSNHGGVWVDATMACMQPLDIWVHHAIEPSKIWMYHGRDKGRGPASWFIVSCPNAYIINKWNDICRHFWNLNPLYVEYFWMDKLFAHLALSDPKFLEEWKRVPFLNCDDYGSAHCMKNIVYSFTPEILSHLQDVLPFAIKLCSRGRFHPGTNAWHILDIALQSPKEHHPPKWQDPPSFEHANFFHI